MRAGTTLVPGEPADLRLVLPAGAAWLATWLAASWPAGRGLACACALAGAAVMLLAVSRRGSCVVVAAVGICAAGAFAATSWRVAAVQRGPLPALAKAHASVALEIRVNGDPRRIQVSSGPGKGSRSIVVFDAVATRVEASAAGVHMSVHSPVFVLASGSGWLNLQPSQRVRATGRLAPARSGEFDSAAFDPRGSPTTIGGLSLVQGWAARVRAALSDASAPLPDGPGGLLPGLVDGDVSRLPADTAADFATTGLTHLVAVSGANVAILLGAVLSMARWLGASPRMQALVGGVSIVAFVVVARPQPSVLRAAAMGVVALLALATGRRRRALPALAASVLLLIYANPALARSVGFALSVLATAALLVLAPPLRDRLARRLPAKVAEALAVPIAASVACAPLIASFAGRVSLVAVPANVLAEPAVAPATILGVLTACVAPWWTTGAQVLAHGGGVFCAWIVFVARSFARLPAAAVRWPDGAAGEVALTAVLGSAVFGWWILGRGRAVQPVGGRWRGRR